MSCSKISGARHEIGGSWPRLGKERLPARNGRYAHGTKTLLWLTLAAMEARSICSVSQQCWLIYATKVS